MGPKGVPHSCARREHGGGPGVFARTEHGFDQGESADRARIRPGKKHGCWRGEAWILADPCFFFFGGDGGGRRTAALRCRRPCKGAVALAGSGSFPSAGQQWVPRGSLITSHRRGTNPDGVPAQASPPALSTPQTGDTCHRGRHRGAPLFDRDGGGGAAASATPSRASTPDAPLKAVPKITGTVGSPPGPAPRPP